MSSIFIPPNPVSGRGLSARQSSYRSWHVNVCFQPFTSLAGLNKDQPFISLVGLKKIKYKERELHIPCCSILVDGGKG